MSTCSSSSHDLSRCRLPLSFFSSSNRGETRRVGTGCCTKAARLPFGNCLLRPAADKTHIPRHSPPDHPRYRHLSRTRNSHPHSDNYFFQFHPKWLSGFPRIALNLRSTSSSRSTNIQVRHRSGQHLLFAQAPHVSDNVLDLGLC